MDADALRQYLEFYQDLHIETLYRRTALQATVVTSYEAVDNYGNVSQQAVGIEVNNGAIPKWRANAQLGWAYTSWQVSWIFRYIDSVKESCGNASITAVPGCSTGESFSGRICRKSPQTTLGRVPPPAQPSKAQQKGRLFIPVNSSLPC